MTLAMGFLSREGTNFSTHLVLRSFAASCARILLKNSSALFRLFFLDLVFSSMKSIYFLDLDVKTDLEPEILFGINFLKFLEDHIFPSMYLEWN